MVSPELQRQFIKRGIELVPPDIGVKSLDHEISHGDKGKVEVIIGGVDGWVES
jgi:hypothetical protein